MTLQPTSSLGGVFAFANLSPSQSQADFVPCMVIKSSAYHLITKPCPAMDYSRSPFSMAVEFIISVSIV